MPKNAANDAKRNIYITRQQSLQLGLSFYIGEKPCKGCGYKKPVRYVQSCNCVNCQSMRYKGEG